MSKRHQANRRKSYGRRQHELHERTDCDRQPETHALVPDDAAPGGMVDRLAFLDPRAPRLRYLLGD